ncbi:MAG: flagellar export protein FliJ [Lawsonibacter sp.]|nr:flagellar export protein FliJ [Lawsonibacter sp.]
MKKFKFSLDSVLAYKQQVLDALKGEHAAILAQVRGQEERLEAIWSGYRTYNEEYRQRKAEGMTIVEATLYQNGLRALEMDIQRETERLEDLRRQEEAKRREVVEARQDTSSLEKLKDKKLDLYQKAVQKSEEALIDEFISSARSRTSA